jgi:transcriptional regulator with XRE-family HTH domain
MSNSLQIPGTNLRYVRRTVGLSQVAFAAKLGLSRSLLGKLESQQEGYQEISDRVRVRVADEFGAYLQPEGAAHPVLDILDRPYSYSSFEQHRKRNMLPSTYHYPPEVVGAAMKLVTAAAKKTGYSSSLDDAIGRALQWLATAPGFDGALESEILEQPVDLSATEKKAALWLLRFFMLPKVKSSLPGFLGFTSSGEPYFATDNSRPPEPSPATIGSNVVDSRVSPAPAPIKR